MEGAATSLQEKRLLKNEEDLKRYYGSVYCK